MAKIKSKKRNISEIINNKMKNRKNNTNPFEVHVNRQKFNVLGRVLKQDRGLPGIARAKSLKKRKETLLQEYKVKDKTNKFLDHRIGERNVNMTNEDKILARFTAERLKSHKRKTMFNLGEDVLTHKGRSLAEIENFENPSSDEEEDLSKGKLGANFVEEAHFGGGLLKRADESKGRADVIDQLIAESKKRKAEKQVAKEKTLEKTEELDTEWRELMPLVATGAPGSSTGADPVEKKDPYDLLMNQLKFEARGTPSDRLKSENELAAEDAKKLRELEEERLRRMRGDNPAEVSERKKQNKYRSADDLDDGFDFKEDEVFELIYDKQGNLISKYEPEIHEKAHSTLASSHNDEASDLEEELSEDDKEEQISGDEEEEEEKEVEEDADSSSDSEGEGVFDLSDMKNSEDKEESEEEIEQPSGNSDEMNEVYTDSMETPQLPVKSSVSTSAEGKKLTKKKVAFDSVVKTIDPTVVSAPSKTEEELKKEEEERKRIMEIAKAQLPFTFKIPETYEEMFDLMNDRNPAEQTVIIERMIKCNHPSLNEKNKPLLNNLFAFLLQLLNDYDHLYCWQFLNNVAPFCFELAKFSPSNAAFSLSEVLKEKHNDFLEKKHRYPTFETLVFLKLIPVLFPTSDKRHPVTTPALVFISEMLQQCQVTNRRAISTGLFLVTLLSQYVSLSKRILPEAVNFLCGILHLATPVSSDGPIVPPFQREHKFLYLQEPIVDIGDKELKMLASDLAPKSFKIDDSFRVRSIYAALNLIDILIDLWKEIPGCWFLLAPLLTHIEMLQVNKYPNVVNSLVEKIKTTLNAIKSSGFEPIKKQEKKPKALRLYDPNIQPVYDNRKRKANDNQSENKKLLTKYKREMKGALREIRRDRTFLAGVKFKEVAKSDAARMNKVKEIFSWGKQQQSELNRLERKKKRRK